jgi:hypothetical protein
MNQMIELHDSNIAVSWFDYGSAIIIFSHAYIHRSEGEPGKDSGTGWSQRAELVIGEAVEIKLPPAWPCKIYDGFWELNGVVHENEIPLPFVGEGKVRLKLDIADGDDNFMSVEFVGKDAQLTLLGEARYVEEFRAQVE